MSQQVTPALSPYLTVRNAAEAIDFYCEALGATEMFRLTDPVDGRIGHAQLRFGNTIMMLSDEYPDFGALAPVAFGGSPVKLHLQVADVDQTFQKAIAAGASELRAVKVEFYGGRSGVLVDPFGHTWHLETAVEEVSPQEMQTRWNDMGSV